MHRKYIIGNWKMNPLNKEDAVKLSKSINSLSFSDEVFVGVAVPSLFLSDVFSESSNLKVGAQNCFWEDTTGAFTGEISPTQIKDSGGSFVILGHSERRLYLKETDEQIAKKVKTVLNTDLLAVLCIGEGLDIRDKGDEKAKEYVSDQIDKAFSFLPDDLEKTNIVITYEPVWAISSFKGSKPATPKVVSSMVNYIKSYVDKKYNFSVPVLYGGSTNPDNIDSFLSIESLSGFLVGSASLSADKFSQMIDKINS